MKIYYAVPRARHIIPGFVTFTVDDWTKRRILQEYRILRRCGTPPGDARNAVSCLLMWGKNVEEIA